MLGLEQLKHIITPFLTSFCLQVSEIKGHIIAWRWLGVWYATVTLSRQMTWYIWNMEQIFFVETTTTSCTTGQRSPTFSRTFSPFYVSNTQSTTFTHTNNRQSQGFTTIPLQRQVLHIATGMHPQTYPLYCWVKQTQDFLGNFLLAHLAVISSTVQLHASRHLTS